MTLDSVSQGKTKNVYTRAVLKHLWPNHESVDLDDMKCMPKDLSIINMSP